MNRIYRWVCVAAAFAMLICLSPGQVIAYTNADLQELVAANNAEQRLSEYKDNETTLKLKLEMLDLINENRARHGCAPLKLDVLACRVASKTSSEAAKGNYWGHWNLRGEKPYHRFAFGGGVDHASENASMRWSSAAMTKSYSEVLGFTKDAHQRMYNETPPNDGHRLNILNSWHTHVGLGFSLINNNFRYYELYLDRYCEFDAVPSTAGVGQKVDIAGRVTKPGYGVYFAIVYYEPEPSPMSPSEISGKGSYPDFTPEQAAKMAFWDIRFDDASGRFSYSFTPSRPGLYYVHTYVKKGHTSKEKPGYVSTQGLSPVSGIVVRVK